jgi:hypothetical protein
MNVRENFFGALTLRNETFVTLRGKSDVFLRGFLVLFVAGLIAGAFAALDTAIRDFLPPPTQQQVIDSALDSFRSSYRGSPEMAPLIEGYVREGASMVYELLSLEPRAGQTARPIGTILTAVGSMLALPFSWAWAGWLLFAGLLIHFTSRLLGGRAGIAQMLGLTALAAAPQVFLAVNSLLGFLVATTGVPLGWLTSLLGFVVAVWAAVIYIKATAVAQDFSMARALGAIALGYVLLFVVFLMLLVVFVAAIVILAAPVASTVQ